MSERNVVIVDDTVLLAWLAGDLDVGTGELATTSSWWFRLARALLGNRGGALGRRLAEAPADVRRRLRHDVVDLPTAVTVLHPRDTVALAAGLAATHGLNLLAADALATAQVLEGRLLVSAADDGPRLRTAAASLNIDYRTRSATTEAD